MNKTVTAVLLIILALFLLHAASLNFIQDDAFISYRYARNLVAGRGLVFNPGERVEGYTNFLWIILMAFFTGLGINTILASKIFGLACGCLALVLLFKVSRHVLRRERKEAEPDRKELRTERWLALVPVILLAANGSFAYWTVSGLESGLFVMMTLLSTYLYFTRERLMVPSCVLLTLVRPEGGLIFAIFIFHKLFIRKHGLSASLRYVAGFAFLLLPYLAFKIAYYGDLLPNPFYAKTGFSWGYLRAGLAYFWLFLKHYGLWGGLFLISLPLLKNSSSESRLLFLVAWIYSAYVILVGGDVLQGHRFLLPVLPFLYVFVSLALMRVHRMPRTGSAGRYGLAVATALFVLSTFFLPHRWLQNTRSAEIGLCRKMAWCGIRLRNSLGSEFTIAASTIGAVSYYSEATVIDMLGLTDRFIARHPEQIPGIVSSWGEKRYHTQYVLSRDPDVILFSTGMKPSAPAERALFLNSKFRNDYYPFYLPQDNILQVVFRRKREFSRKNVVFPDASFVNLFNEALNLEAEDRFGDAEKTVEEVIMTGPPDFAWAYDKMASFYFMMKARDRAKSSALKAIDLDDYCVLSHYILKGLYLADGDTVGARREHDKILQYNPEFLQIGRGGNFSL